MILIGSNIKGREEMFQKDNLLDIYTKFKNGESHYLSIPELVNVIEKLKNNDSSMIQNHISIIPFYRHKDFQIEIDERIIYIGLRDKVDKDDVNEFYENEKCEEDFYNFDLEKRTFLIQKKNKQSYIESLDGIISYLYILIQYILQRLRTEYNLKDADLLFGNVCFELLYK